MMSFVLTGLRVDKASEDKGKGIKEICEKEWQETQTPLKSVESAVVFTHLLFIVRLKAKKHYWWNITVILILRQMQTVKHYYMK